MNIRTFHEIMFFSLFFVTKSRNYNTWFLFRVYGILGNGAFFIPFRLSVSQLGKCGLVDSRIEGFDALVESGLLSEHYQKTIWLMLQSRDQRDHLRPGKATVLFCSTSVYS